MKIITTLKLFNTKHSFPRQPYYTVGALGHLGHCFGALGALVWGTWGTRLGHLGHSSGALEEIFWGTWGTNYATETPICYYSLAWESWSTTVKLPTPDLPETVDLVIFPKSKFSGVRRSESLLAGISWSERYWCRGLAGPRGLILEYGIVKQQELWTNLSVSIAIYW